MAETVAMSAIRASAGKRAPLFDDGMLEFDRDVQAHRRRCRHCPSQTAFCPAEIVAPSRRTIRPICVRHWLSKNCCLTSDAFADLAQNGFTRCSCSSHRSSVPPVRVVSGARAFGRHHRRAERMLGRAFFAERGTLMRLLDAFQHEAADAQGGFLGVDFLDFEDPFGIVVAKLVLQFVTALRNRSDTTPLAIAHLEHSVDQLLRGAFPSRVITRLYWFSTSARPASSWRTVFKMPSSRSAGSNPVMTIGTL